MPRQPLHLCSIQQLRDRLQLRNPSRSDAFHTSQSLKKVVHRDVGGGCKVELGVVTLAKIIHRQATKIGSQHPSVVYLIVETTHLKAEVKGGCLVV